MTKRILDKIRSWFSELSIPYEPLVISNLIPPKPTCTITVHVGDKILGAIQSLTISERQTIQDPSTTSVSLTACRIRLARERIAEVFSGGFVHVASQEYPLQIIINDDETITTIQNAWLSSIDESYQTNDWVIINAADLEAEKLISKKKCLEQT